MYLLLQLLLHLNQFEVTILHLIWFIWGEFCKAADLTPRGWRSYCPCGGAVAQWYGGNGLEWYHKTVMNCGENGGGNKCHVTLNDAWLLTCRQHEQKVLIHSNLQMQKVCECILSVKVLSGIFRKSLLLMTPVAVKWTAVNVQLLVLALEALANIILGIGQNSDGTVLWL